MQDTDQQHDPRIPNSAHGLQIVDRSGANSVALESTLLVHGVPRDAGPELAASLAERCRSHGASPAFVGLVRGTPTVGMTDAELKTLLDAEHVTKANTANLGVLMHRRQHGATTVSTTMELAARSRARVFATGGLGGVHREYAEHLDISSDLAAFTRFPVAVVCSGVKSILDVSATREALETLGVPIVGYRTDRFPAFYLRESEACVDARFDDLDALAAFVDAELRRTGRGIVIANPIPEADELDADDWAAWLGDAERRAADAGATGRAVTPAVLAALHEISVNATLRANIALVESNTDLAARIAALFTHPS